MKKIKVLEKFSLLPQGVRYKILVAFCLMSVIPLLVIAYIVNNTLFLKENIPPGEVSVIILFCVIIAWLGLYVAKGVVERIIDVALESRAIAEGDYERRIKIDTGDEIGQIGETINFLTQKIRSNMSDIREYQTKMKEINADIQRKVSILSNLLQIGELIASSVKLENVLDVVLSKLSQQYEGGFAALYMPDEKKGAFVLRASSNLGNQGLARAAITEGEGFLGKALRNRKHVILDSSSKFSSPAQEFKAKYKCENLVGFPLAAPGKVRGLLVVGNNIRNFTYTSDDIDVIRVFAEQVAIAVENDILIRKAKKLEIKDELTGLFNSAYMQNRLAEEIERAITAQRPCSFILVDLDDFEKYGKEKGPAQAEIALKKIAQAISKFATSAGRVGRVDDDTFAFVLPEVNKKEALEIADRIRKEIESLPLSKDKDDRLTASGGVSENPLDGSSAGEIIEKAQAALNKAKEVGKNRVLTLGV